ncbi:helix-turn-helix domain-containing protein [Roseateles saccharophilus]|uniref:Transposase n=1 Tax=Roseateles saccharophilus TaxID=304 RepID=A0A4R3U5J7_ROSSA|nr:helix-turn-helix domain-containing protein [Roseateles saccharophilus]MDG0836261.1 helix-turn-helix domain-containing protein [Roseateles saccharophilus]TCU81197.1 transposase [Roseateles saccharophilus]
MTRPPKITPKRLALQESGTVNTHAEGVQDSTFVGSEFFDPHDLVQVRYEMLRRVSAEGLSITDAVARFGVTRPTFYKAQSDFARAGLVGLLPAKRGPHGPHKITDEVMRFIEQSRQDDSQLDGPALVERIHQQFGLVVHRRTVERALTPSKKKHR